MKLAFLTAAAISIALVSGCATVAETASSAKTAMEKTMAGGGAIAEAKAVQATATKSGCAWTQADGMIKKAEKLEAEGKTDEANALAGVAKRQAENGLAQCKSEAERLAKSS